MADDEKKDPLADTNMEYYASETAQKVRKAAADTEKAWDGAGKEEGLQIWRIEQFNVVHWPKEKYGKFFQGDSYIVLHTYKPDPNEEDLDYNVFFWLGKETTQDEYGTAAYKTVELDTYLGGEPVQFREVQGIESEEWGELWGKSGTTIMAGGAKSGFKKVEDEEWTPRLMWANGKNRKNTKIKEIPLEAKNVSEADCYVLDTGMKAYVFFGSNASVWEKQLANKFVDKLQGERGKMEDANVDGLGDDTPDSEEFWKALGGKPESLIEQYVEGDEDEKKEETEMSVSKISDSKGGSVTMTDVDFKVDDDGKLSMDMLCTTDVFVIDDGKCVWVWTGKEASPLERKMAIPVLSENKEYARRAMRRVCEGKETAAFKKLFA